MGLTFALGSGTTISPWVIPLEALEPFSVPPKHTQNPAPFPHLAWPDSSTGALNIHLKTSLIRTFLSHPFLPHAASHSMLSRQRQASPSRLQQPFIPLLDAIPGANAPRRRGLRAQHGRYHGHGHHFWRREYMTVLPTSLNWVFAADFFLNAIRARPFYLNHFS